MREMDEESGWHLKARVKSMLARKHGDIAKK